MRITGKGTVINSVKSTVLGMERIAAKGTLKGHSEKYS